MSHQPPQIMMFDPSEQVMERMNIDAENTRAFLLSNNSNARQPNHLKTLTNIPYKQIRSTKLHRIHEIPTNLEQVTKAY